MKNADIGRAVQIAANFAVVAGIIFLGVELHQNNELLDAEARQGRIDRSINGQNFFGNPDVAVAIAKIQDGEDLTSVERLQVNAYVMSFFRLWEANFEEVQRGTLDDSTILMRQRRILRKGTINGIPLQDYWAAYKSFSSAEFREWVEENLGNK